MVASDTVSVTPVPSAPALRALCLFGARVKRAPGTISLRRNGEFMAGIYRSPKAKTERCTASVIVANPFWHDAVLPRVEEQTANERDAALQQRAHELGATYEHGIFGWTIKAKNVADAKTKIIDTFKLIGFDVELSKEMESR